MAELIVKAMPVDEQEKKAYIYYRQGLNAQDSGDYSEALECYEESLKLEMNAVDRSETLKNMAIIYMSNGDEDRALDTYQKSLDDISKVLDLEPRHFGALSGRAQIYIDLELYQNALKDLKDAKKIHPVIRGNKLIDELEKLINGQNI